jgi:hypothetical protein
MDCKNISKKSLKSNTAALWLKIYFFYPLWLLSKKRACFSLPRFEKKGNS